MLNDKWITVDAVIERVARTYPDVEINRSDAAEWCFDVVRDVGVFPSFLEKREIIPVVNGVAQLPCDVYRILHVAPDSSVANAYTSAFRNSWYVENHGGYLEVANSSQHGIPRSLMVDYLAFKVDDSGYPMIFVEARDAAAYYITMKLKEADFIAGRMDPQRFQWLEQRYHAELEYAKVRTMRWTDREELDRIVKVARSIIRPAHYAVPPR